MQLHIYITLNDAEHDDNNSTHSVLLSVLTTVL